MIADLFCGAGGWTLAARGLGMDVVGYDSTPGNALTPQPGKASSPT
jgi:hypothetical protein